jgi:hypothetical protein
MLLDTFVGIPEDRDKFYGPIDTPTPVNLSPGLRIVVEAVSCGQTHNIALTSFGVSFRNLNIDNNS